MALKSFEETEKIQTVQETKAQREPNKVNEQSQQPQPQQKDSKTQIEANPPVDSKPLPFVTVQVPFDIFKSEIDSHTATVMPREVPSWTKELPVVTVTTPFQIYSGDIIASKTNVTTLKPKYFDPIKAPIVTVEVPFEITKVNHIDDKKISIWPKMEPNPKDIKEVPVVTIELSFKIIKVTVTGNKLKIEGQDILTGTDENAEVIKELLMEPVQSQSQKPQTQPQQKESIAQIETNGPVDSKPLPFVTLEVPFDIFKSKIDSHTATVIPKEKPSWTTELPAVTVTTPFQIYSGDIIASKTNVTTLMPRYFDPIKAPIVTVEVPFKIYETKQKTDKKISFWPLVLPEPENNKVVPVVTIELSFKIIKATVTGNILRIEGQDILTGIDENTEVIKKLPEEHGIEFVSKFVNIGEHGEFVRFMKASNVSDRKTELEKKKLRLKKMREDKVRYS